MNERIRELHNQARDFYLQDEYMDLSMKDLHRLVEEKFAELIVKDCADFVQFYYKDHACEGIAYDMKTHFGVKE